MRISPILATAAALALYACSGNSQNSSSNSPAPEESTNPAGAMATAAANAGHAVAGAAGAMGTAASNAGHAMAGAAGTAAKNAAGAAGAVAKSAAGAAGAVAGGVAQMAPHSMTYTLKALNGSGEDGKVMLVGTGNKTTVTISLGNENTTGKQPAHIHTGPCSSIGGVKYPLSDVVLGKSVTVVDAPLATLTSGGFAVNVHESAADLSKYVSCGDLTKANMMT